jgi:hypothetical protein
LPGGLFSSPKDQFGSILEALRLENVDISYDHLEYFTDIWDILQTFGIFYYHRVHFVSIWYIFPSFGITYKQKSGSPGSGNHRQFIASTEVAEKNSALLVQRNIFEKKMLISFSVPL